MVKAPQQFGAGGARISLRISPFGNRRTRAIAQRLIRAGVESFKSPRCYLPESRVAAASTGNDLHRRGRGLLLRPPAAEVGGAGVCQRDPLCAAVADAKWHSPMS